MTEIIACEFLTLDGVMSESEAWQPPYVTPDVADVLTAHIHGADGSLLGRATYDMFAAYWPLQTNNEFGIADKLNSEPKYVVSTTLQTADWHNTTLLHAADEVARLRQQPGGYLRLVGSGTLTRSLAQAGLIDEFWLLVHPVVRGHGQRLFDATVNARLELTEMRSFQSGVVLLRYRPQNREG